ncbi:LamG domain-containing protein [bacterium]|nr:LamG domain-containing protein [bacterium]
MAKSLFALALLATPCLLYAAPPAAPLTPDASTVLLWHCDEGQGEQVADASGQGHVGKITGAQWTEGKFGQALVWGEGNGNMNTPGNFPPLQAFTLQAWVRLDKMPTGQIPFWTADVCGQLGATGITIRPPGLMYVGVQLGSQANHLTGQTKIPVGQWTHLALVYDGAARKIGLFVNGQVDIELDVPPGSPVQVNQPGNRFWVRSYGGGDEKLVGAIDEISLSSRAETFGYKWRSNVYVHLLRYQSAFLVGSPVSGGADGTITGYVLQVKDAAGKSLVDKVLTAAQVAAGALVPAPGLAAGEVVATVTALRADKTREQLTEQAFHFTPPVRDVVSLTPDNICLVGGKPFFPLGAYHVRQSDLQTIRDGGMNIGIPFTATFPPGWQRPSDGVGYIEKCGEVGIMGVAIGGHKDALAHYRGHPNVLFWYVDDEPGGEGRQPADTLKRYEDWAAADPTHLQFLLHNKPAEFMRYAPACDVFACDPYPIRRDATADMMHVVRYTEGAVAAVFDRKPVWVALQCYTVKAVSEAGKSGDGVPRLPTPAELRCMSYLALAAGARGLLYYAFDDTYYNNGRIRGVNIGQEYPEFWAQMTQVMKELGGLQRLWLSPHAALRPENLTPEVVVQRQPFACGGRTYLLVVNPKYEGRAVRVKLPGVKRTGQVKDGLGGTAGKIAGGELTDTLEALQAKCYEL